MDIMPGTTSRKVLPFLVSALILGTLILSACATAAAPTSAPSATSPPQPTAAPTSATPPTAAPTEAVEPSISLVSDPVLGSILVGDKGMTLYIFTKDTADTSNCNAECLEKWPPLLTQGSPKLGEGVDAAMIGSAPLADGTKIVTYNHMPLYYWFKDVKAGDTTGQGVGDVWFVIAPDGSMVQPAPASTNDNANSNANSNTNGNSNENENGNSNDDNSNANNNSAAVISEPTISVVEDPTYGPILVGDDGLTLYMFTKDTTDLSNCKGDCLVKWPPLLTLGNPILGEGVDPAMVGTAEMPDGTLIVTYNHMPLYYWYEDTKAGDTLGQDVGSVWYVVAPDGTVNKTPPPA